MTARAMYRGYHSGSGKRAGQVRRLHVIREHGPAGWEPGKQTLCGQHAWACRHSDPVIISPLPDRAPDGLAWCPKCIGLLAELLGLLGEIAASLAACGSFLDVAIEARHDLQRAVRAGAGD
jgi:hypothetical protein